MQSRGHFELLSIVHGVVYAVLMIVVVVLAVIGWRRHRHFGFVILAGWGALAIVRTLTLGLVQPLLGRLAAAVSVPQTDLFIMSNLLFGVVHTLVLVCALFMLVFRPSLPPREVDTAAR